MSGKQILILIPKKGMWDVLWLLGYPMSAGFTLGLCPYSGSGAWGDLRAQPGKLPHSKQKRAEVWGGLEVY